MHDAKLEYICAKRKGVERKFQAQGINCFLKCTLSVLVAKLFQFDVCDFFIPRKVASFQNFFCPFHICLSINCIDNCKALIIEKTVRVELEDFLARNMFQQQYHIILKYSYTVGARIPNKFGIRMVQSCSVLVPTIRNPNNGQPRSFYK